MRRYIHIKFTFAFVAVLLTAMFLNNPSMAITLGLIADNATKKVTVFNADSDTILGSLLIQEDTENTTIGAVSITADQKIGFVTTFNFHVWVIDLSNPSAPTLAAGTNPIVIPNFGESLTISPDNKYLLVSDGSAVQPIAVIDIASRIVVSTFPFDPPQDTTSVAFAQDGSLLTTSFNNSTINRLLLSPTGVLTNTGFVISGQNAPMHAYGVLNAGVAINFLSSNIQSFTLPTMTPVDSRQLSSNGGLVGVLSPNNTLFYARANTTVDVFTFDSNTGHLGLSPSFTIPTDAILNAFFGIQSLAIYPNGSKLYASENAKVNVYNAHTGVFISTITGPSISEPTGIAIRLEPPSVSKIFTPEVVCGSSKLVITLSNPASIPATLLEPLVDRLPRDLKIIGDVKTTCLGGVVEARDNKIILTEGTIQENSSCKIIAFVTSDCDGNFRNTIPSNALRTTNGNNILSTSAAVTFCCDTTMENRQMCTNTIDEDDNMSLIIK